MPGPVFAHIDAMLAPEALEELVQFPVTGVETTPVDTEGFSGNSFERIRCTGPDGSEARLMLKRFDPEDWIARLTDDTDLREISLLEAGRYQDLPDECLAPMLAAVRGPEASMLMWDVSDSLFPEGDHLIEDGHLETCLAGAAALHARYWGDTTPVGDSSSFCSPESWIGLLHPNVGRTRVGLGVDNDITASLETGWESFLEHVSAVAARTVTALQRDGSALLHALDRSPRALIHGDLKLANLGIDPSARLVMLDWTFIGVWSPFVDLGWFLAVNSARLPVPKESVIERYRRLLAGHGIEAPADWQRDVDLGLLAGGVLRLGWAKALGASAADEAVRARETAEVAWWGEVAERSGRWLG